MWGQELFIDPGDPGRSGPHCCGWQIGPQLRAVGFLDAQLQSGLSPAGFLYARVSAWPGMQTDQTRRNAAAPARQSLGNIGMT
jgi:hypothetical protein